MYFEHVLIVGIWTPPHIPPGSPLCFNRQFGSTFMSYINLSFHVFTSSLGFTSEGKCAIFISLEIDLLCLIWFCPSCIHFPGNNRISLFIVENSPILYVCHIFFIYSSVDRHLAWLHYLAIVSSATVDIDVQASLQMGTWSLLGKFPGTLHIFFCCCC